MSPIRNEQQTVSGAKAPHDIIEELRRRYDLLTHSQKRIAEYIVEQSQAVAFSTVDQIAAQLGVNPSTIVRFCYRLGLNGFPGLQERMRQVVRRQLARIDEQAEAGVSQKREFDNSNLFEISNFRTREAFYGRRMLKGAFYENDVEEDRRPPDMQYISEDWGEAIFSTDRAAAAFAGLHRPDESEFRALRYTTMPLPADTNGTHLQGTTFGESLSHDLRNLRRTIMGLTADDLKRAVDQLTAARRVYVVAAFSAFSLAHYFGLVLSRLRPDVHTIQSDDGVSKVRLAEMGQQDCLVAFTFPRYAQFTQRAAAWAKEQKSTIIVITDTPISAVGQIADTVLVAFPSSTGMQHSMAAPMAVANALLNGVIAAKGNDALGRYSNSDSLFDMLNSFLLKLDQGD
jgi:DNA-binding MurR/RpiR family transcriptional regulator